MGDTYNLKFLLEILFRRKVLLIVPLLIAPALSGIAYLASPKVYESVTTILVQRDDLLNPLVEWQMGSAILRMQDRMGGFDEIVRSRKLIDTVIEMLGLDADALTPEDRDRLYVDVRDRVLPRKMGSSFEIRTMAENPQEAADLARAVREEFIKIALETDAKKAQAAVLFIDGQVTNFGHQAEMARQKAVEFQRVMTEKDELTQSDLMKRLDNIGNAINEQVLSLRLLDEKVSLAREQRDLYPRWLPAADQVASGGVEVEIERLRLEKRKLLGDRKESHPLVVSIDNQIDKLETMLAEQRVLREISGSGGEAPEQAPPGMTLNPEWARLDQSLKALDNDRRLAERELALMEQTIEGLKGQLPEVIERSREARELDLQAERMDQIVNSMAGRLEQARVNRAIELAQQKARYRVLDDARVPTSPSRPRKLFFAMAGVMGGFGAGFVLLLLAELLDPTYRRTTDFTASIRYPVLAEIPKIQYERQAVSVVAPDPTRLAG